MRSEPDPKPAGIRPPGDLNPRRDPPLDFPDADYGALSAADYTALGFMAGLEVHQQLLTRSKLFCRCPAGRYVDRCDAEVLRHMRPTLSELGEYDGTALMEFKTRKEIVYRLERGSVCTYEIDDTPPFEIDDEAVRIALEIAQLLDLNLVSELHVMRKQYLDGSIPTGFQRTAMVGLEGVVPFRVPELGVRRDLTIRQLSLEEDSCREVRDRGHRITFRTDRLGMPLSETVTEPELDTPLEVQAAIRLVADVARATGKVRRGPGAARQDVNVSVAGGRRIEIKGVDSHGLVPRLVHIEAFRQLNLLRLVAELERRGVAGDMLAEPAPGLPWETSPLVRDVGGLLGASVPEPIDRAREGGQVVCAVRLPGFAGLLTHRTQPGRDFAHEVAERVRVIACPTHHPFLMHSDGEGLGEVTWRELRRVLGASPDDAVVIVWADRDDAATAAREILIRAREALAGVPPETRQVSRDGTTGFERILPGPDRMYPDTDTPPRPIADSVVRAIRQRLPETPWAREERYERLGLASRAARRLARAPWRRVFDAVEPAAGEVARRFAAVLETRVPHHSRAGAGGVPAVARLAALVRAVETGAMRPEAMRCVFDRLVAAPETRAAEIIAACSRDPGDHEELERAVEAVVARAAMLEGRAADTLLRWAMGEIMPAFLGKIDPAVVRERLVDRMLERAPEVAT